MIEETILYLIGIIGFIFGTIWFLYYGEKIYHKYGKYDLGDYFMTKEVGFRIFTISLFGYYLTIITLIIVGICLK